MEQPLATLPRIHSFGLRLFGSCWCTQRHVSKTDELYVIRHGKLKLEIYDSVYDAGPGDVVLIPQQTEHRDRFDLSQDFEVFMFSFFWPEADKPLFAALPSPVISGLSDEQRLHIHQQLDNFYTADPQENEYETLLCRSYFHSMLLYLLRAASGTPGNASAGDKTATATEKRKFWLIHEVKNYINQNYARQVTLEELAAILGVSPFHLSRTFNSGSGFSLSEYLTLVRMDNARALLSEGRLNVSQVAYAVGYEDSGYFSKVFKKHFGCSPSAASCQRPVQRV